MREKRFCTSQFCQRCNFVAEAVSSVTVEAVFQRRFFRDGFVRQLDSEFVMARGFCVSAEAVWQVYGEGVVW